MTVVGHLAPGGAWHGGPDGTCTRYPCSTDYGAVVPVNPVTFPQGGHGELYCPYCSATLLAFGLPVDVDAHKRESPVDHTGRPKQINRALRLAQMSRTDVVD